MGSQEGFALNLISQEFGWPRLNSILLVKLYIEPIRRYGGVVQMRLPYHYLISHIIVLLAVCLGANFLSHT